MPRLIRVHWAHVILLVLLCGSSNEWLHKNSCKSKMEYWLIKVMLDFGRAHGVQLKLHVWSWLQIKKFYFWRGIFIDCLEVEESQFSAVQHEICESTATWQVTNHSYISQDYWTSIAPIFQWWSSIESWFTCVCLLFTVKPFVFAIINFLILPMECQFVANNFHISLAILINF